MLLFFNSACNLRQGDHHLRQKMKFLFYLFLFHALSLCLFLSLIRSSVPVSCSLCMCLPPSVPCLSISLLSYTSCLTFPLCWVSPLYPSFNVLRCGNRWELCHCTRQLFYDASHLCISLFLDRLVTVNSMWLDVASNLLPLETCYITQFVVFNYLQYVFTFVRCIVFELFLFFSTWFLTSWPLSQHHT